MTISSALRSIPKTPEKEKQRIERGFKWLKTEKLMIMRNGV